MRNIYTCIDIGSDSIKIVVCELYHDRYNLLATSIVKSEGIKKGLIIDPILAKRSIKEAILQVENILGFKINKVIAIIPSYFAEFTIVKGEIVVGGIVSGDDIVKVLQKAMMSNRISEREMITTIPIDFEIDDGYYKNPINYQTKKLKTRAVMVTTPSKNVYSVVELLNSIHIDVVDLSLGCIGDINIFKTKENEKNITCVVNIGADKTEVSIFNKGIVVKQSIINMGSKNVDSDIAYMYKLSNETAKKLKESFAIANVSSASANEIKEVENKNGKMIKINQYELSEIVNSRLNELLMLVNQEISKLTPHSPNVIYVTGGITNMINFSYICREKLGKCAIIGSVELIGLRNNKFSQAIGNIIYFVNKLKLSNKNYSMVDLKDCEILSNSKKNDNNSMIGKLVGYFFGE